MLKDDTLRLLLSTDAPLSGQAMSRELKVSRAAIWKAVEALRSEGYQIEALPSRGYRLTASPDVLSPGALARPGQAVGNTVICLERVDSTNDECRRRAASGSPSGLVVLAGEQTGGKGRRGRTFQSLPGKGLYLSALLRPQVTLAQVSQLTAWTAVAVCRALKALTGLICDIKWPNDILLGGKKLCGILTELGLEGETGALDHVVVGIGINVSQREGDFGPELSPIATSLAQHMAAPPLRVQVASALLDQLEALWNGFPQQKGEYLAEYRQRCITIGREVKLIRPSGDTLAQATAVNDDFSLQVLLPDGTQETISAGEVSVRGLLGYT